MVYSGLAEKWTKFQETMDKIAEIRKEVTKITRNKNQKNKKEETNLTHHFQKTPIETSFTKQELHKKEEEIAELVSVK